MDGRGARHSLPQVHLQQSPEGSGGGPDGGLGPGSNRASVPAISGMVFLCGNSGSRPDPGWPVTAGGTCSCKIKTEEHAN
jgi:hypothetical protein